MSITPVEAIAALLGLINIVLVVRRSVWNYPFALAMVSLYGWVFFGAKLYSDALLQIFFFVINLYGWWNWASNRAATGEVTVTAMRPGQRAVWMAGCAAATAVWGWGMHRFTDAAFPWWDAAVAMMSIVAQILMSRRYFENWVLWIAVDGIAIALYAARDLWLTAALYGVFLAMSIWGLIDWRRRIAG